MNDAVERLMAAVAPLLDPEVLSPYYSAWEINNYGGEEPDGKRMWRELKAAYDAVLAAPRPGSFSEKFWAQIDEVTGQ